LERKWPEAAQRAKHMLEYLTSHAAAYPGNYPSVWSIIGDSILYGPAFQKEYMSAWKTTRLRWLGIEFQFEEPPKTRYDCWFDWSNGYNGIFHWAFFIFWDEDPEDYLISLDPEGWGQPDPEVLQKLEDTAARLSEELLSDQEIGEEPPLSYMYMPTSSSAFDGHRNTPEWLLEWEGAIGDDEETVLIGKRTLIPKQPGEVRDAVSIRPESLRRFKRITWNLARAVARLPNCPLGRDMKYLESMMLKSGKEDRSWYMRDFEKCGLTVPKEVIRAVTKGFYRRNPAYSDMACHFYDGIQLYLSGEPGEDCLHPLRGHFLGYWTEGTTLLQYCIHDLVVEYIGNNEVYYSAMNDDMFAGFKNKKSAQIYQEADSMFINSLSLAYKNSKSGICSHGFVYCEEYIHSKNLVPKDSLVRAALLSAHRAINIVHAKQCANSIYSSRPCNTRPVEEAIQDLIITWGYEFCEEECNWPYEFGGWVTPYTNGIRDPLLGYDGSYDMMAGYWTVHSHYGKSPEYTQKSHTAIGRKLSLSLIDEKAYREWDDYAHLLPLLGSKETLMRLYLRQTQWKTFINSYEEVRKARSAKYKKLLLNIPELKDVETDWYVRAPDTYIRELHGMETELSLDVKEISSLNSRTGSLESKLSVLQDEMVVSCNLPRTTLIERSLARLGYLPFQRKKVPYCSKGVSRALCNSRGESHLEFYERTMKCVVKAGPSDTTDRFIYMAAELNGCIETGFVSEKFHELIDEYEWTTVEDTLEYLRERPEPTELLTVESEEESALTDLVERTRQNLAEYIQQLQVFQLNNRPIHEIVVGAGISVDGLDENEEGFGDVWADLE